MTTPTPTPTPAPAPATAVDPKRFPWSELGELFDAVEHAVKSIGAGKSPDEVAVAIAEWLSAHVDWRLVFPGPVGMALEAVDDQAPRAVLALVKLLVKLAPFRKRKDAAGN